MILSSNPITFELEYRETVRILPISPMIVTCQYGSVWLTACDGPDDWLLGPGARIVLKPHCDWIAQGLGQSRLSIESYRNGATRRYSLASTSFRVSFEKLHLSSLVQLKGVIEFSR